MPLLKSAIKKMRQDKIRTARNKLKREKLRTTIKAVEDAVKNKSGDLTMLLKTAQKTIDKCVKHCIIHANNGARKKSQLAKISKNSQ